MSEVDCVARYKPSSSVVVRVSAGGAVSLVVDGVTIAATEGGSHSVSVEDARPISTRNTVKIVAPSPRVECHDCGRRVSHKDIHPDGLCFDCACENDDGRFDFDGGYGTGPWHEANDMLSN